MLIVDCLTDNPNRTFGDVRQCFVKTKSKIGTPGNVSHLFDHCAIFKLKAVDEEAVLEALLDADVDVADIESEGGFITAFTPNTDYGSARQALCDSLATTKEKSTLTQTLFSFCRRQLSSWEATTSRFLKSLSIYLTT